MKTNMNRRAKLSALLIFMSFSLWGQNAITSSEDVIKGKEINQIKKTEGALYADTYQEITADEADLAEAQKRSMDMLKTHVIEVFSKRLNMTNEDVREIWSTLESRCKNIVVKKGDLFRVFTYVLKNSLGLTAPGAENIENLDPEPLIAQVEPEVEVKVEVQQEEQVVVQQEVTNANVVAETKVETQEASEIESEVVMPAPASVVAPEPAPVVEVKVPALCQTMFEKKNMTELLKYLRSEKDYQHLMFGNFNSMQYPEKCYIVILDRTSREIITILDKGESDRMNFVTKQLDRFNHYRGGNYSAIFVQEY